VNWRDRLVLVGLTGILVIVGLSLGLPEAAAPVGRPSMVPVTDPPDRPYVEGVVGPLDQVSPLSARSQAERNAVALVFSGLVRLGPDETLVPDLAESWSVNDTGNQWTFRLRADATWHDGEAVTADDVAFTVNILKNESYTGPGAASWGEVSATVVDRLTVRFDLVTPLGGFLQAATQPIVPRHVLAGIPAAFLSAPTSTFGREPVGSGPFRLTSLAAQRAEFAPAVRSAPGQTPGPGPGSSPSALVDALRTAAPAVVPPRPTALLSGIEFRVFDSPDDLALAWQVASWTARPGWLQRSRRS
jgi:ABC-type transport system substrate-binding protein